MGSISPRVEMVEPTQSQKSGELKQGNSHVDEDNAEWPDISSTRAVSWCHVVPAFWRKDKLRRE